MWFAKALSDNDFLNWTIGFCQLMVILIPIISKKALIDRQPNNFFKKHFIHRIKAGVYFMIFFSCIAVYLTNKKDKNSDATAHSFQIDTAKIISAIRKAGYSYDKSNDSLIKRFDKFRLTITPNQYQTKKGEPRLSNKSIFPFWADTMFNNHKGILVLHIYNVGSTRADSIRIAVMFFPKHYAKINENYPKGVLYFNSLEPGTGIEYKLPIPFIYKPTEKDTMYAITRLSCKDSLGRSLSNVYGYYIYIKSDGISLSGLTGYELDGAISFRKSLKF